MYIRKTSLCQHYSVFFSIVFIDGFGECNQENDIKYTSPGKPFNNHILAVKTKFCWRLFVISCIWIAVTLSRIQNLIYSALYISFRKHANRSTPQSQITVYTEPSIYVGNKNLKVVDRFIYLGSTINRFCSFDDVIASRLKKGNGRFLCLDSVWLKMELEKSTKHEVYMWNMAV